MSYKQVILVRDDLKLPKGKLAAQSSHASVDATLKSDKKIVELWKKEGGKKIVLKVKDEKELFKYKQMAEDAGLKTALIQDAGHTVLEPGTVTCLGIGPDEDKKIDRIRAIKGVVGTNDRGEREEIRANLVLAADGANSMVAIKMGLNKNPDDHHIVALRAYYKNVKECFIQIFCSVI